MRTRKEIENLQEYEVCRYDGLGKPPTCHQEVPTQIELLLDIRDVLAKPKEDILKIHDAIIDLATDLEEGNISTARKNAITILKD